LKEIFAGQGHINLDNLCKCNYSHVYTNTNIKNMPQQKLIKKINNNKNTRNKQENKKNKQENNETYQIKFFNLDNKFKNIYEMTKPKTINEKAKKGRPAYTEEQATTAKILRDKVSKLVEHENETRRLRGENPLEGDALKKFKKRVASNMDLEPSKTDNREQISTHTTAQAPKKRTISIIANQPKINLAKPVNGDDLASSIDKLTNKSEKYNLLIPPSIDKKQQDKTKIEVVRKFNINNSINHQLSDSCTTSDDENGENRSFFIKQSEFAFKKTKIDKSEIIERDRIRALILKTGKLDADKHSDQIEVLIDQELQKNVFAKLINNNKIINKQPVIIPSSLTLTHQPAVQQSQVVIPSTSEAIEILNELSKDTPSLVEIQKANPTTKQNDRFSNVIENALQTIENMEQDLNMNKKATLANTATLAANAQHGLNIEDNFSGTDERLSSNSFRVTTGLAGGGSLASSELNQLTREPLKSVFSKYGEKNLPQIEMEITHVNENINLNSSRVTTGMTRGGALASSKLIRVVAENKVHKPAIVVNNMTSYWENETSLNNEKTDHVSAFPCNQLVLDIDVVKSKLKNKNQLHDLDTTNNLTVYHSQNNTIAETSSFLLNLDVGAILEQSIMDNTIQDNSKNDQRKANNSVCSRNQIDSEMDSSINIIKSSTENNHMHTIQNTPVVNGLFKFNKQITSTAQRESVSLHIEQKSSLNNDELTKELLKLPTNVCTSLNNYACTNNTAVDRIDMLKHIGFQNGVLSDEDFISQRPLNFNKPLSNKTTGSSYIPSKNYDISNLTKAVRKTRNEVMPLSSHKSTYAVYTSKLNKHLEQKIETWFHKLNDALNFKYPCNDYSLIIYSKSINLNTNSSDFFLHEIERCTKITKDCIESIEIVKNKKENELPGILINVLDYKHFVTLKNPKCWPKNAFKTGIDIEIMAPKLYVIIHNVEIGLTITNDELVSLEANHGIIDVKRIPDADGNDTKKLKAGVKSVWHFIEVLKRGIRLNWRKRKVTADIRRCKPCHECGSLRHSGKKIKCTLGPRCILCSSTAHTAKNCENLVRKCLNCRLDHSTSDRSCKMIDTRMKELNKYIINMLLSEGVYKNENEVLYGNEHGNQPNITTSNLASMVNELVNDKFLIQSDEIKSCQKDVMELTNKLKTCETTTKKLTDEIIETNKNLDCLKLTVESLPTNDTLLTFGKNLSSAMLIGVSEIINKK
jgi:hypothetical protein